ncbi:MAG TPA: UvrD-helicase domain-containing protein, partial [Bryobacteraceae bacterium]|nr:UvrD-helicase domain-containing protein [Bryobacteraceae bacterium]
MRFARHLPHRNPMKLTPTQIAAIERSEDNVCVVAGPGSGKTSVLIERFAWLVERRSIDPARILAITFTEKAAAEIQQRLAERFTAASADPQLRGSIERAWVSTIDGFCARLLRENSIAAGLPPDFAVLDAARAAQLALQAAEQALEEMFQSDPRSMGRLFEALDAPDLAASLLEVYESMRISGVRELASPPPENVWERARQLATVMRDDRTPTGAHVSAMRAFAASFVTLPSAVAPAHFQVLARTADFNLGRIGKTSRALAAAQEFKHEIAPRLRAQWIEEYYSTVRDLLHRALARLDVIFRESKLLQTAIDFAGLEEETIRLLESNPAIRERAASRFDYILMDELQDTNPLQWRLVNLIRRRFFGVGDINQSIFGFRHADPEVFARYRAEVAAAGAPIDDLRENHRSTAEILDATARVLHLQPGIESRVLIASRTDSGDVELLVGQGDRAPEVEASLIADRILELHHSNVELKDIAILLRALTSTEPIERALDAFGVPFLVSGGRTFLEAREIRDVMLLLAALVNPLDEVAIVGVLRGPLVGLSDAEILRLGRDGWQIEFEKLFGALRRRDSAPDLLLSLALDECNFLGKLPERSRANIGKFLGRLRETYSRNPQPLAELLDDLEALRLSQSEAEAPPPDAQNAVRIMTIHAAKGLEFPVVFVSALQRTTDTGGSALAFSAAAGLGAKWRDPATSKNEGDATYRAIREQLKKKESEEENRLLYVAMTRAKDRLILSYAESKKPSNWQKLVAAAIAPTKIAAQPLAPRQLRLSASAQSPPDLLLDPPRVTQRESAAPVTAVAMFHGCPRKYLLSLHSPRERGIASEETGGRAFGSAVHRILAGGHVDDADAVELAARFQASELGARAARAQRIEREFDFLFYFEDLVLRGQIDLWFEEAGELVVVDYKTD